MDEGDRLGKEAQHLHRSSARGAHTEIEGGEDDRVVLFSEREAREEMGLRALVVLTTHK